MQAQRFFIILFCLFSLSCSQRNGDTGSTSVDESSPWLSAKLKSEGWRPLFDEKSLAGWQIFKSRSNNTWEAVDGVLHCKAVQEDVPGVGDQRADLITSEQFENFELMFDWKISAQGNSGVIFRVSEEFDQTYHSGPEYQLMDDNGFPNEVPLHFTGANYGLHTTTTKILRPLDEWNSTRLVVNKSHVEHWLNGQKVVEYELWSDDWKARVAASKWKDFKSYGMTMSGHIALQDHGSEAWFRNIFIRTL